MRLLSAFKAFWRELKGESIKLPQLEKNEKPEDPSHLRLLSFMQQSGRLIDFVKEDLTEYSDADIGASIRPIHKELAKLLEEMVTIRPVIEELEGASITIPVGFDGQKIKVVGKVKGQPPYTGTVLHQGWKAHKRSLPKAVGEANLEIIAPAEVEVK